MAFTKNMQYKLAASGFLPLEGIGGINPEEKFSRFIKYDGPVWYVVLLSDGESTSLSEIKEEKEGTEKFLIWLKKNYSPRSILVLNLIVTHSVDSNLAEFIDSDNSPYIDEAINYVYWAVDPVTGRIYFNKNRPTAILNIRSLISQCAGIDGVLPEETKKDINSSGPLVLTVMIIFVNVLLYVLMELNGGSKNTGVLLRFGCIEPLLVLTEGQYYRLVTSVFLHIGLSHLAYNCFSIFIFGSRVERTYGRGAYLFIYLFSGIAGALFSSLFTRSIAAGASGAIFGLVGAMLVLTFMTKQIVEGFNTQNIVVYAIIAISMGFLQGGVDNFGHLGGFLGGITSGALMLVLKKALGGIYHDRQS